WRNEEMCDVVLDIGGEQIPAHRIILASLSPYFKTLFSSALGVSGGNKQDTVTIYELEPEAAKAMVEFAYTRKLAVSSSNVQGLLSAASFLQLSKVKEACAASLSNELCPYNCVGISVFAHLHGLDRLQKTADRMISEKFPEVLEAGELVDVPFESHLLPVLQETSLARAFPTEICEAALAWLEHDWVPREEYLEQIIEIIPLHRVPPHHLKEVLLPKFNMITERPIFQEALEKTKDKNNQTKTCTGAGKPSTLDNPMKTRSTDKPYGVIDMDREICKSLEDTYNPYYDDLYDGGDIYTFGFTHLYERGKPKAEDKTSSKSMFNIMVPVIEKFNNMKNTDLRSYTLTDNGEEYLRGKSSTLTSKEFLSTFVKTSSTLVSIGGIKTCSTQLYSPSIDSAVYKAERSVYKSSQYEGGRSILFMSRLVLHRSSKPGKAFQTIDIKRNRMNSLPEMSFSRTDLGASLYNGHIYAVGGSIMTSPDSTESTDVDSSSVECFDIEGGGSSWKTVSSMAYPRDTTRSAVIDNRLFAVGGGVGIISEHNTQSPAELELSHRSAFEIYFNRRRQRETKTYEVSYHSMKTVEAYDHRTGQWSEMAPLQTARRGHGLVAYDERLYCAGGYDDNRCLDSVECYEPRMNRWYIVASLNTPRHGVALGVVNGTLYAVGGNKDYDRVVAGSFDHDIMCPLFEIYNPWENSWESIKKASPSYYSPDYSCYCTSVVSLYNLSD
ncbi:uncharacterized protein LOC144449654, partial [Glandiceps talaboti]